MSVLAIYIQTKEDICREAAEKTAQLYLSGMSYKEALEKVKKIYNFIDRD